MGRSYGPSRVQTGPGCCSALIRIWLPGLLAMQIKRLDDRGSNLLELSCSETTERPLELIGVHSGGQPGHHEAGLTQSIGGGGLQHVGQWVAAKSLFRAQGKHHEQA